MKSRLLIWTLTGACLWASAAMAASEYPAQALPLDALTPGTTNPAVTQDNIQKTICRPKWVKNARPPTSYADRVKELHVKRSDLADKKLKNYVADFRIPLEVGGGTDPGNIWAQPAGAGWSAKAKDKLEIYVQREVCAGRMKLQDAQQVFQKNWVDVFHLYCGPKADGPCNPPGTDVPLQSTR